ncbi:MAG: NAD(P)-binding domain-containing protein [Pirellulaceae bacterium]
MLETFHDGTLKPHFFPDSNTPVELESDSLAEAEWLRHWARGIAGESSTRGWSIAFHDPSPAAAESFQKSVPQARLCQDNQAVCQSSELVLLAVKPQLVADVLPRLAADLADRLVLSVAGLKLERLASMIGHHRIVRAMPNTPALVGEERIVAGLRAALWPTEPRHRALPRSAGRRRFPSGCWTP